MKCPDNKISDFARLLRGVNMYLVFVLLILFLSCDKKPDINVMTFNIRYNNPNDGINQWENRKDNVCGIIKKYHADIVGVQEALFDQVTYIDDQFPKFEFIGVGRDDGKKSGEFSAIFYDSSRFKKINSDNFWLSETPEIPGSLGWDAACVRIVTWGQFRDLKTGKSLFVFNTHFDHLGKKARIESAHLLRNLANIPRTIYLY